MSNRTASLLMLSAGCILLPITLYVVTSRFLPFTVVGFVFLPLSLWLSQKQIACPKCGKTVVSPLGGPASHCSCCGARLEQD